MKSAVRKILTISLSCICLTSCGKINDAKKEATKIPGYIDNIKKSKITYNEKDTNRIAKYVANGEKSKFIKEMSKNAMKKKGTMEKINELFSYMDGKNIKTRHRTYVSYKNYTQYWFKFQNEKKHYYLFIFEFIPLDINDADNTDIKSFYIVQTADMEKDKKIRNPVDTGINSSYIFETEGGNLHLLPPISKNKKAR